MIKLSRAAAVEIRRMQSKHQNQKALLKLGVIAGGCQDWAYTMELSEQVQESDQIYECEGMQVIVDAGGTEYIDDLTLDYSEDLMGGGFRFHNRKATQTCGCGNSFSIEKKLDTAPLK